jgi:hypothetical protein
LLEKNFNYSVIFLGLSARLIHFAGEVYVVSFSSGKVRIESVKRGFVVPYWIFRDLLHNYYVSLTTWMLSFIVRSIFVNPVSTTKYKKIISDSRLLTTLNLFKLIMVALGTWQFLILKMRFSVL